MTVPRFQNAVLLAVLVAVPLASARAAAGSPHGDPAGCAACHTTDPQGGRGPARSSAETCVACHPTADMHPVGIAPSTVSVAAGFPLENGLLSCITCHVEPAHGGAAAVPAPYHRGGPYARTRDLCFKCHEEEGYQRANPHQPADRACAACHVAPPGPGVLPEQARLRADPKAVCAGCHEGPVHTGLSAHLQAAAPPGAGLALPVDGSIQCWTCHDVHNHAARSDPPESPFVSGLHAAARGGSWARLPPAKAREAAAAPPLLAQPESGAALCAACHGEGP